MKTTEVHINARGKRTGIPGPYKKHNEEMVSNSEYWKLIS